MMRSTNAGFSMIELMVAAAVSAVVATSGALLFANMVRRGQVAGQVGEMEDRARLVRALISQDLLAAGGFWNHGGKNTGATLPTGTFGTAGRAAGLAVDAAWPKYPIDGTDSVDAASDDTGHDQIILMVPRGEPVGVISGGTCSSAASMNLTAANNPPASLTAGTWGAVGDLVLLGGYAGASYSGFSLLSYLDTDTPTAAAGHLHVHQAASANDCTIHAGAATTSLPASLSAVPVKFVKYQIIGSNLLRCEFATNASGPKNTDCDTTNDVIMPDMDDLQFQYVFSVGNSGAIAEYAENSVAKITDEAATINGAEKKRDAAAGSYTRFYAVNVGVVARGHKPDTATYNNRGKRPALFGHVAGSTDSYRRTKTTWRTVVPNAFMSFTN